MLNRLKMLSKAPQNATVFAIGADDAESLQQLQEALALSPQFRRLVLISPDPISLEPLDGADRRITRWSTPVADFTALVASAQDLGCAVTRFEPQEFYLSRNAGDLLHNWTKNSEMLRNFQSLIHPAQLGGRFNALELSLGENQGNCTTALRRIAMNCD